VIEVGNIGDIAAENLSLITSGTGTISLLGTLELDIYDNLGGDNPAESNDQLLLSSSTSIVLGGTLKVTDTTTFATDWVEGDKWQLLDWSSVTAANKFTGGFTAYDLPTLNAGLNWITSTDGTGFYISVGVVPEPGRALLLFGALAVLSMRRRRA
jgi:fibronectin-binding autotransporter adhesin